MSAGLDLPYGVRPPRYRLPDDSRLGRVWLQVSDLRRSLQFYTKVLGLQVLTQSTTDASLAAQGESHPMIELREKAGIRPVPRRGLLGLYHFALLLPDRAALGRFIAHLGALGMRAGMSDHFVSEAVYIDDPDGLGIEVYADRPREQWKHEDRQLTMATEPLDADAVVAAAQGQPWTGMPAGSVVGHVHLFVGDIKQAAAFYHDLIGFDKVVWNYPGALFMSAGGYHHHLGTNVWAAQSPPASDDDARLLEWEILVPSARDVDAIAESVSAGDVAVTREGNRIVLDDPWGTTLAVRPASS